MIRRGGDRHLPASYIVNSSGKKTWTNEEDLRLRELIILHGVGNWTVIADALVDRTGKQCRERWHNHLNPGIKKGEWSEEEDRIIVSMQRALGNQWAKITKMLPGRTDNAVKNRFHATVRARAKRGDKFIVADDAYPIEEENYYEIQDITKSGKDYPCAFGVSYEELQFKKNENEFYPVSIQQQPVTFQQYLYPQQIAQPVPIPFGTVVSMSSNEPCSSDNEDEASIESFEVTDDTCVMSPLELDMAGLVDWFDGTQNMGDDDDEDAMEEDEDSDNRCELDAKQCYSWMKSSCSSLGFPSKTNRNAPFNDDCADDEYNTDVQPSSFCGFGAWRNNNNA